MGNTGTKNPVSYHNTRELASLTGNEDEEGEMGNTMIELLRCPQCHSTALEFKDAQSVECGSCHSRFRRRRDDCIDFLGGDAGAIPIEKITPRQSSRIAMRHWATGRLLAFLPRNAEGRWWLNLGCGDCGDAGLLAARGMTVVNLDLTCCGSTNLIADAHNIPMRDACVDGVVSVSVLEHLHDPFKAIQETARILREGGVLVGSVAFLECYHGGSYYHFSPRGVISLLEKHGFVVEDIDTGWDVLTSILTNLCYGTRPINKMYLWVFYTVIQIRKAIRVLFGRDKPRRIEHFEVTSKQYDRMAFAGSIIFKARKLTT